MMLSSLSGLNILTGGSDDNMPELEAVEALVLLYSSLLIHMLKSYFHWRREIAFYDAIKILIRPSLLRSSLRGREEIGTYPLFQYIDITDFLLAEN